MRALLIAVIVALLAVPAYAQKKTDDEKKREAAEDALNHERYRASADRIPAQKPADPWGNMRDVSKPETKAKPATVKPTPKQ
jgi:hypothetical protein